jgi:hypothetical protein
LSRRDVYSAEVDDKARSFLDDGARDLRHTPQFDAAAGLPVAGRHQRHRQRQESSSFNLADEKISPLFADWERSHPGSRTPVIFFGNGDVPQCVDPSEPTKHSVDLSEIHTMLEEVGCPPEEYPDQEIFDILELGYDPSPGMPPQVNLLPNYSSALQWKERVEATLQDDAKHGDLLGPFDKIPSLPFHVVPQGSVAKNFETDVGKRRRVYDKSAGPTGAPGADSPNSFVPELPQLHWVAIDKIVLAILIIVAVFGAAFLAKADISRAYKHIALTNLALWTQGLSWGGEFFIDISMTFGCAGAAHCWQRFADVLIFITRRKIALATAATRAASSSSWTRLRPYLDDIWLYLSAFLDDFIFVGPSIGDVDGAMATFLAVCGRAGVVINPDKQKLEGVTTTKLTILGCVVDTVRLRISLTESRRSKIMAALASLLQAAKEGSFVTARELKSLLGRLSSFAGFIPCSRLYLNAGYRCLGSPKSRLEPRRIGRDFRHELRWWKRLLTDWEGELLLNIAQRWVGSSRLAVYFRSFATDAARDDSGTAGFGAVIGPYFFWGIWTDEELCWLSINSLEMLVNLFAHKMGAFLFAGHTVDMFIDNEAARLAKANNKPKAALLNYLTRECRLIEARFSYDENPLRVPTELNTGPDDLSRQRIDAFIQDNAARRLIPVALPPSIRDTTELLKLARHYYPTPPRLVRSGQLLR